MNPSSNERNSVAHALLPFQDAVFAAPTSTQKASDRPATVAVDIGCRPQTGTLGFRSQVELLVRSGACRWGLGIHGFFLLVRALSTQVTCVVGR